MMQDKSVKLIAKNSQGSVFISHKALTNALDFFIKKTLESNKMPFTYDRVEFVNFDHEINFQINVFLKPTKLNFNTMLNRQLQSAIFNYIGNVFVLEPITINIILSFENF